MPLTGEAKKAYQRKWVASRRAAWFADKTCAVCGTTENLELDHIDPSVKVSHSIWSWSKVRREVELVKCQVLCTTHHREKIVLNQECLRGAEQPMASYTEAIVLKARTLRSEGLTYQQIADKLGFSHRSIAWNIINKDWKHLNAPVGE